jgi:acyl-CoA hydrolase
MDLIAIAHPKFRAGLIEEARRHHLIYYDQEYLPGERGEHREHLKTRKDHTLRPGNPAEACAHHRRAADEGLLLLALRPQHVPPVSDTHAGGRTSDCRTSW